MAAFKFAVGNSWAKLRVLSSIGLASMALVAGFSVDLQHKQIALDPMPPAQAQFACDNNIRVVRAFPGRTSGSQTRKPNINTMLRADRNTNARVLAQIPPNTLLYFNAWGYGQAITDIWTGRADHRWFRVTYRGQTGWIASGVIWGNPPGNPPLAPNCRTPITQGWLLPWRAGVSARVSQGWHYDFYTNSNNAIDFALPAGTPVLAPVDSTVLASCHAGNNHRSIKLRASNGQVYSLVHVTTATVKGSYRRGEQIGVIAGDRPWNSCARSTGPHLHMGLPSRPFTMGGYTFGNSIPSPVTPR